MKLVEYRRVSTDDKGQDPRRQGDVNQAYAARGKHEIVGVVTDEGTSGSIPPMQRQAFLEAIELAEQEGADGILVEAIDRITRAGVEDLAVTRFFLRVDHDLRLVCANTPPGMTPEMEELYDSMLAMSARAFLRRLKEQVKSGLARAKAQGWPKGEPGTDPKPDLTLAEHEAVIAFMGGPKDPATGKKPGWRRAAHLVSTMRGAFLLNEPKAQRARAISQTWLRKEMARLETRSEVRLWRLPVSHQESETRPAVPE